MSGASGRNAILDDEDAALWAHVAAQVKPLRKANKPALDLAPTKPKRATAVALPPRTPAPPRPSPKPLKPDSRERLPRTDERRLRRGTVDVAGRIDLHGLTREQAHRTVTRFLANLAEDGGRIALVITGKGGRAGGEGVLRGELPRWLSEGSLARSVLAWRPASPRHGGDGAFYVLLRRKGLR
ncbi:MAG: Smr/MutS family protein [Gemmatimonas sp.]